MMEIAVNPAAYIVLLEVVAEDSNNPRCEDARRELLKLRVERSLMTAAHAAIAPIGNRAARRVVAARRRRSNK